jgi:hypothetical protein
MSNPEVMEEGESNGISAEVNGAKSSAAEPTSTNGSLVTNGHTSTKEDCEELTNESNEEDEVEDTAEDETPDEEENLFLSLEEQEKAAAIALDQPKALEAAPRLLQTALKGGQVKADESEEESDKEKDQKPASPEPHIHKRVRTFPLLVVTLLPLRFLMNLYFLYGDWTNTLTPLFVSVTGKSIGVFALQSVGIFQLYCERLG